MALQCMCIGVHILPASCPIVWRCHRTLTLIEHIELMTADLFFKTKR